MITRVDLIGFAIIGGPGNRSHSSYSVRESAWKGWTVDIQGPSVVLTGEGRRIEVPRARCVVAFDDVAPVVVEPKAKATR